MIEQKSEPQTIPAKNQEPSLNTLGSSSKSNVPQRLQPVLTAIKNVFAKFYTNKKVFIIISLALALISVTIIIGVIFGLKNKKAIVIQATPTPVPYATPIPQTPQATGSASVFETRLKSLESDIDKLDVNQSKIKPPELHFDIKF